MENYYQLSISIIIFILNLFFISFFIRNRYVEAVLLETKRLNHVTPVIGPRRVLKNTNLNGYSLPKVKLLQCHIVYYNHNPEPAGGLAGPRAGLFVHETS